MSWFKTNMQFFLLFLFFWQLQYSCNSEIEKENDRKETMKIFLHNFLESEVLEQSSSKELTHLLASNDELKDFKENDLDVECENTCKNDGLCVSGKCFCQNPYIGPSCEFKLKLEDRINTALFYLIGLICVFIGIFLSFLFKCCFALCFSKINSNEEKLGEREVWSKD